MKKLILLFAILTVGCSKEEVEVDKCDCLVVIQYYKRNSLTTPEGFSIEVWNMECSQITAEQVDQSSRDAYFITNPSYPTRPHSYELEDKCN